MATPTQSKRKKPAKQAFLSETAAKLIVVHSTQKSLSRQRTHHYSGFNNNPRIDKIRRSTNPAELGLRV